MALLFKPYHVFPIIAPTLPIVYEPGAKPARKTETRRVWQKRRAKVGATHLCRLDFTANYFAKVDIRDVYQQTLGEMSEEAAENEGGYTLEEYARLWQIINRKPLNPLEEVYVVEMLCVEVNLDMVDVVKYGSMYREHMQALRCAA